MAIGGEGTLVCPGRRRLSVTELPWGMVRWAGGAGEDPLGSTWGVGGLGFPWGVGMATPPCAHQGQTSLNSPLAGGGKSGHVLYSLGFWGPGPRQHPDDGAGDIRPQGSSGCRPEAGRSPMSEA